MKRKWNKEKEMEFFNLGAAVYDHKRHAYQEGREIDCKLMCHDGHLMVSLIDKFDYRVQCGTTSK